jgi:hypothetical protein
MDIKSCDIQTVFIVYQTFALSQVVKLTIVTLTSVSLMSTDGTVVCKKNGNCQNKIDTFLQCFHSVKPSYEIG